MATKLTLSELRERLRMANRQRRLYEPDWVLNLAYINGEQHVEWDNGKRGLRPVEYPRHTVKVTRNVMGKIHQISKSRILKADPTAIALPMTADNRDKIVADIATAALKQWAREDDEEERIRDLVDWQLATGNGFFKTFWDPLQGMPRTVVVPPFEVSLDPYAKLFGDVRWLVHTQFLAPDVVQALYPGAPKKLLGEGRRDTQYSTNINQYTGGGVDTDVPGVTVHEYWERPWSGREEGALIVFTEDGVLAEGPFPYDHKMLPFSHAGHVKRSDSIWHRAHHDFLRSLQDEVNRAEQQIVQNRALANGKWGIPQEIEMQELPDGDPRQVLRWTGPPGIAPIQFPGVPFQQWVAGEPDRLAWAISDLAGQHEVSNGGVPGRVEAASAIQLLQEQDDSIMQDPRRSLEQAVARASTQKLQLFKQYGKPELQVKSYDKNGRFELHTFKKDELALDQRVVVRSTTGLPSSIAGRRDYIDWLLQRGLIQQPMALEMLEIMPEEMDLLSDQTDRNKAVRENEEFRYVKGNEDPENPVVAMPFEDDNHAVHLRIHADFKKSEEYMEMPDAAKLALEFHLDTHRQWELYLYGQEAVKQQILQGIVPPPPRPDQVQQSAGETEPQQIPVQGGAPPDVTPPAQAPGLSVPQSPEFQSANQGGAPAAPAAPPVTSPTRGNG